MRNLLVVSVMAGAALASVGCKKKADGGGGDDSFAKMSAFKDSMCACKDKACADKVTADMTKWSEEMAKKNTAKPVTMSEADTKKYTEVSTKLGECMTKAMTADAAGSAAAPAGSAAAPAGSAAAVAEGSGSAAAAPAPKDDSVADLKDMTLQQPGDQNASNFATAKLWDEKSSNGEQFDLEIQDVRNRPYMIKEFETPPEGGTKETVGTYPALVTKGMFGPKLSVLVNKGGIVASATTSRGAAEKNIEALKKAVQMMDLAGLEKNDMKKPELDGKTLMKYLPKLKAQK